MMRGSGGIAPGRGLGATPPEAEGFFSMSSQKTAFWSMKIRYLQVSELWIWIWIYTSQKPINGYKRDGTGRAHQLFLYRSPLLLKSSMFIKIVLGGHYNHV